MITPYDLIGVFGTSISIFSYARVQWQREYAKHFSYSLLNLTSAGFLAISLLNNWNLASFINNGVWGLISAYGLYRCTKNYIEEQKSLSRQETLERALDDDPFMPVRTLLDWNEVNGQKPRNHDKNRGGEGTQSD